MSFDLTERSNKEVLIIHDFTKQGKFLTKAPVIHTPEELYILHPGKPDRQNDRF